MHWSFLTGEQRGLRLFVITMAVFSTICHVLLYTALFAYVYQMRHFWTKI